jgi:phage minor structural protein
MAIIPKYIEVKTAADNRAAFLSPKSDGLKDVYPDCRLNGESTLEFLLPATSSKIAELTPECQIWAGGRVYTLLRDEAVDTVRDENNKLWAKFMAVERWAELNTSFVEPSLSNDPLSPIPSDLAVIIVGGGSNLSGGLYQTGTAAHALYAVLQDSGWTLGTCDVPGIHDLEMEKVSRLALIKEIQNIWGGYLVWDSVNKTVSLRDPNTWQNYTGFQIRYRKNLEHITRTQSNRLVTKLYAFGHDDLDIADVNGGEKFIINHSYTSRDYIGIYKNQDIYDAQELLEKATAELSLICRPRYLYKTKMIDLRTLPEYSHEDFAVGDMADVIDPDVAPDSPRVRIIRHKYNLFQPWKCEVEIGDPEERLIEKLKASFSTTGFVDGKFNGNGQSSGYSIEDLTIEDAKIKNLSAEKIKANTVLVNVNMAVGSGNNIFKVDSKGIYLGNAVFADAPFSVDMAGNLIALSATIQGTISSSIIIGSTILTAAINNERMELKGTGLVSYAADNDKQGIAIETNTYGFSCLNYYANNILVGGLIYNGAGGFVLRGYNGVDLVINNNVDFSGASASGLENSGYAIDSEIRQWVTDNFVHI